VKTPKSVQPISIIVLNHNGRHFLEDCLSSVLKQDCAPFEVILVDNGSVDGSIDFVKERYPSVRLLALKSNQGFAGGNNRGVEIATHDLIVLLNNDTRVEQGWLEALAAAMEPEDVAVASALILTEGIPARYYEKNGSLNFLGHNIMRIYDKREDIFYAGGASLIYKRNLLGLPFDEDYFAYSEDAWLGLRARFAGYAVRHVHQAVVHHYGSGTTRKQMNSFVTFLQERNRLLNTFTFFSLFTIVRVFPVIMFASLAKTASAVIGKKYSVAGLLRAYGWFITHPLKVAAKRRALRAEQRVPDRTIVSMMTCNITNGESPLGRVANFCTKAYFGLVGLRTIEFSPRSELLNELKTTTRI
jgi:hypothetical protein